MIRRLFPILLLPIALWIGGCAKPPEVVLITPPAGYRQLPPAPIVPTGNVSNAQLAHYLFDLHDAERFCRTQMDKLNDWIKQETDHVQRP